MPFIITTVDPTRRIGAQGIKPRAVATIEDVADAIETIADAWLDTLDGYTVKQHRQYRAIIEAWHSMDETAGGTIAVPDGRIISVQPMSAVDMLEMFDDPNEIDNALCHLDGVEHDAAVIDAYNAR